MALTAAEEVEYIALLELEELDRSAEAKLDALKTLYRPQPGPQTDFLNSTADITIFGGAAGGGKTRALLLDPLKHVDNPRFGGVIFRRTTVQIRTEGGLWDESKSLYLASDAVPKEHDLWWKFPSGAAITFAHLEHEKNVHDYQGAQIPFIGFDEVTHFTEAQFWYLVSRNRSMCGVKPYIRATCNPDAESWVADLISWWIDPDTGYPIPERASVVRFFVRVGEKLIWGSRPEELSRFTDPITGHPIPPKSMTFIPSKLQDNPALMRADPGYLANLMALPSVERERLLGGNWKIRWGGQDFFPASSLLVDNKPLADPIRCDAVFAIIDTATKTGTANDGTAVTYFARTTTGPYPLLILDWDYVQIEGAMLETWLPGVLKHLEQLAADCKARMGSLGAWIEDKAAGEILIQQAKRRNLKAKAIESRLTALGKDERALSVSGYVNRGKVKITERAYHKVVTFKGVAKNHLISQVTNFRIGDKDAAKRADDLLDTFTYGIALGLGDSGGF